MLHDKFPTTAFVYIDGHPFSNHSAAAVLYLEYQVDRMYAVVKISHFPSMYIIYNIHAVAILWDGVRIITINSNPTDFNTISKTLLIKITVSNLLVNS